MCIWKVWGSDDASQLILIWVAGGVRVHDSWNFEQVKLHYALSNKTF